MSRVEIREALLEEVPSFAEMEEAEDTASFIIPYNFERHNAEFSKRSTIYLSIVDAERLVGFMILVLDPDGISVEFRRVVVSIKGEGFGQLAITLMEDFCRVKLGRKRIWLDVFEFNERGRHIYEKLGYVQFNKGEPDGKPLYYYEKTL